MENFGSWSVLTTNFLVVLYLALAGVTFASILHLANGKWRFQVRYFAVATAGLFPLAGVLLLILLSSGENTFQWLSHAHEGEHHLNGWHDYGFLVARQILGFLVVSGFFLLFIKYQHMTDVSDDPKVHRTFRNIALTIPGVYVLYGTMIAWDFEMTMIPGWHSASYGVYQFVSMFHFFLAFFAIVLIMLYRSGKVAKPYKPFVFNYLAQMMLAFTILWTYFYFTQYLIMWYGRLPYEMDRFFAMMNNGLAPLWWTFLVLKFIIPFVTFATWTPNRHSPNAIMFVSFSIVLGTWIERYTWISGSVSPEYYHIPMSSIFDIVVTLVVAAAAWFSMRMVMTKYGLVRA
ncbi:MAG TPA: hypothetical protein ENI97_05475 [Gammaproteobacteria bacterium]|nr:hypothetical protein [Gammaproteobacteria bacterium]